MKNYGLIIPPIETREQGVEHFLGSKKLGTTVINPSGDWTPYLPVKEPQEKNGVETQNCTGFGTLNAIETLENFLIKGAYDHSDRAVGIAAGTSPYKGNDPHTVAETIRNQTIVFDESYLPFSDSIDTPEEYYIPKPLPKFYYDTGQVWADQYDLAHEWVFNGGAPDYKKLKLQEALTKGTVCVSVYAWLQGADGKYIKPQGTTDNHWCQLIRYENDCPVIFDSYDAYEKTLEPLYDFGIAKLYNLTAAQPKINIMAKILDIIGKILGWDELLIKNRPNLQPPQLPQVVPQFIPDIPPKYLWDHPLTARHSVRLICDEEGLSVNDKNILTACVQVESGFNPKAVGKLNINGTRDWGICQFNDGKNKNGQAFWIGSNATFSSTDEVLNNPEKCVRVMCKMWKAGKQNLWSSYNNGSYKQYL